MLSQLEQNLIKKGKSNFLPDEEFYRLQNLQHSLKQNKNGSSQLIKIVRAVLRHQNKLRKNSQHKTFKPPVGIWGWGAPYY